MRNFENRHHLLWPRRDYQSDHVLNNLRSRYGLILVMDKERHGELHKAFDAPPVIPRTFAASLSNYLDGVHSSDEVLASAEWLYNRSDNINLEVDERQLLANIASHLLAQDQFIRGGNYEAAQRLLDRRQVS